MKISRNDPKPTLVKLTVMAQGPELLPIKSHVLKHFSRQVKVPGFRAGSAPAATVEKYVNQQELLDEFIEHALNQLYGQAVSSEKIRAVAPPQVSLKKFVPYSLLEFEAEVEVLGPIMLPDYKKIKAPQKIVSVTLDEVNGVLKSLRSRTATRKQAPRAAKSGDEVLIDFIGKDTSGKLIKGATGKDYPLILGSGNFIPGFEDNLTGLKENDKKTFTLKFPKDYSVVELRNADVTFDVTVTKVNELSEPKLDDTFAAKAGPFKDLNELKNNIKQSLQAEKQAQAGREYENELVRAIAAKSKVDVPASLVETEIKRMEDEEKRNLLNQGQTWQEHLKHEGLSEEEHFEKQRPIAVERLKGGLILSEIADKENITVLDAEVEQRIEQLKARYTDPAMQAELDNPKNRQDIEARLLTEKTLTRIVEYSSSNKK